MGKGLTINVDNDVTITFVNKGKKVVVDDGNVKNVWKNKKKKRSKKEKTKRRGQ